MANPFGLTARDLDIFVSRFSQRPDTLETVGQRWRVSRERVRQLQRQILQKVRSSSTFTTAIAEANIVLGETGYVTYDQLCTLVSRNTGLSHNRAASGVASIVLAELTSGHENDLKGYAAVEGPGVAQKLRVIESAYVEFLMSEDESNRRNIATVLLHRAELRAIGLQWLERVVADFGQLWGG